MKTFAHTRLFSLLKSPTSKNISSHDLQTAYEDFTNTLIQKMQDRFSSPLELYLELIFTRIELDTLCQSCEQKTNAHLYLAKALLFINAEIDIIKEQLSKSNIFAGDQAHLYLPGTPPPLKWTANHIDLVELIYGLHATRSINNGDATIKQIATAFEKTFGTKIQNTSLKFVRIRERSKERLTFSRNLFETLSALIKERD
jgi:hypothetical protein